MSTAESQHAETRGRAADAPEAAESTTEPDPLSDDEVFHLLQCRRRRDALRYLAAHEGGPVRMRDLAEQVAAWEHETTVQALSSKERQRVYIPLYQTHLPKLDEAGVIEYDQHRGRVSRGPLAGQLAPYLSVGAEDRPMEEPDADDRPADDRLVPDDTPVVRPAAEESGVDATTADRGWARYYRGAVGASALLLVGAALDAPLLATLSGAVVAGLVALLFAAVSVGDLATDAGLPLAGWLSGRG